MGNRDITGVNRVVINDDGGSEGFMLPSFGFVENGGNAYVNYLKDGNDAGPHTRFDGNGKVYIYGEGDGYAWHDGRSSFSKKSNGYSLLPNGLILQWGTASATAGRTSVKTDFPIPFPNDCLVAVGCDNEDAYPDPVGTGWTRTQVSTTTDENGVVRYIALGY